MKNLYYIAETLTNGYSLFLLILLAAFAVLSSVSVIISKNPIVSVLFLIGLFFGIAGYLSMLGINFIGISYLLVYVGAVSILFLFILMLINIRVSELITNNSNSIPLAIMIGIFFTITILPFNYNNVLSGSNMMIKIINDNFLVPLWNLFNISNGNIYFVTSHIWDGVLAEVSHITSIGNVLYVIYPMWLLITSIILLLAMVGAIVITIN